MLSSLTAWATSPEAEIVADGFYTSLGGSFGSLPYLALSAAAAWMWRKLGVTQIEGQVEKAYQTAFANAPVSRVNVQEFHRRLKTAYCGPKSLRELKRDGTLPALADEFQHVQRQFAQDGQYTDYIQKTRDFILKCFDRENRNKSSVLQKLLDAASDALPQGDLTAKEWNELKKQCATNSMFALFIRPFAETRRRSEGRSAGAT